MSAQLWQAGITGQNGAEARRGKLYYSKTEDGAGTLIGKTVNTDSLIRNLDARILTNGSKVYYTVESTKTRTWQEGRQDRHLLRRRQWQQSKAGQNDYEIGERKASAGQCLWRQAVLQSEL